MNSSYCALNAKTKAMYADCLSADDYRVMLSKSTVAELFAYLRDETDYKTVLSSVSEYEIHRGKIEKALRRYTYNQYIRLYNFISGEQRRILQIWMTRIEVYLIKQSMRAAVNGKPFEAKEFLNDFFIAHTKIDCKALAEAQSLGDVAEACRRTKYYDLLKRSLLGDSNNFSVWMMMDKLYYTEMWQERKKITPKEREAFEKFVGTSIDLLNLTWIYRAKNFNIENNLIYTYLIPVNYRLNREKIKEITESDHPESVDTPYNELFAHMDREGFIDINLRRMRNRLAKKVFVNYPDTMASVFAYLYIKNTETEMITVIMEAIRYGADKEKVSGYIENLDIFRKDV